MSDPPLEEHLQLIHHVDQCWEHIRGYREDIERVASSGLEPDDELLVDGVFNYVLARMTLDDLNLGEFSV